MSYHLCLIIVLLSLLGCDPAATRSRRPLPATVSRARSATVPRPRPVPQPRPSTPTTQPDVASTYAPTSPDSLPVTVGDGGLSGLYGRIKTRVRVAAVPGGGYLESYTRPYFFFPTGHYTDTIPQEGYERLDCLQATPDVRQRCGTYRIAGDMFQFDQQPPVPFSQGTRAQDGTPTLKIGKDTFFLIPPAQDLRLNGHFGKTVGASTGQPGASITSVGSSGYTFTPDGRFTSSHGAMISAPGMVGASNSPRSTGTYTIEGYTLELQFDDGRVQRHVFWVNTTNSVFIDGQLWTGARRN